MATTTTTTTTQTGLADAALLEKIDKLFACGVGDLVDLPQIIAVGDQSSGKSSVLEGLVHQSFPRDSGLCTRFATQFVFKRAAIERISVSLIAAPEASEEQKTALEKWGHKDLESLDSNRFVSIMKEVHEILGLRASDDTNTSKPTFSNSVLRLEISGPTQEHLIVIDVPGIFRNTSGGNTTKEDIVLVRDMVTKYMENPRSVMLVVVPANVDAATQEILEMARQVDPEGDRTLGVLTKPDLVDKGAERQVLSMLNGNTVKMQLGWHVVRNPGQQELLDASLPRDVLESNFFRKAAPWNTLDTSKIGVSALRARLNEVLTTLVKKEFPKVAAEITRQLIDNTKVLKNMGAERSTSIAQATYLNDLSVQFQTLMTKAIDGKFASDSTFDEHPALKLATAVGARMEAFGKDIAIHGHKHVFCRPVDTTGNDASLYRGTDDDLITRKTDDIEPLEELLQPCNFISRENVPPILKWLDQTYKECRGLELGTFNPEILSSILRQQSADWADISLGFVSDVIVLVHQCILTALEHIIPDKAVRSSLLNVLNEELLDRYEFALKHTKFLLSVERDVPPHTLNHYFNDNLQKTRQSRLGAKMKELAMEIPAYGKMVRVEDAAITHPMSNTQHIVQDLHDILRAYYAVARPKTPLNLFSSALIRELSEEDLQNIAGEAPSMQRKREQLAKEIASLNEAKSIVSRAKAMH